MNIAVIAAHPDDEVLGCGATIARLACEHEVHTLILGEGVTSRFDQRGEADPQALERLRGDARAAGEILGARSVGFGGLPDNRFDEVALLDVIKLVERWIGEVQPDVIYTHHPGDLNIDHGVVFRAVMTATRPAKGVRVRDIYTFEVPSSTDWAFQRIEPVFRPNVFVDVSSTLETKIQAMERYTGEARAFPHPRAPEALRAVARRWGTIVGTDAAEAFDLVRSVR